VTTPTSGTIHHLYAGRDMLCSTHIQNLKSLWLVDYQLWRYERNAKCRNLGGLGSLTVIRNVTIWWSAVDFNKNYASILYHFRVIMLSYLLKVMYFNLPYLHLAPPLGVTTFEFCHDLWYQKNRIPDLLCSIVCMIVHLAILIQYWHVTEHTHRHMTTA